MESDDRGMYWEGSTHIRGISYHGYLTEQALRPGYVGPELGSAQLEHFRVYDYSQHPRYHPPSCPLPLPHSRDIHNAIHIESEKEHIRKDIIMSEIARRRALEAEVRRELMMEREWVCRQGSAGLIYGSTLTMGFDSSMRLPRLGTTAERWSLGERNVPSLMGTERPNCRYESTSGWTADLKFSEVNPVLENDKGKERIILQANPPVSENVKEKIIILRAKPGENISGSKRKAEIPPLEVEANESPSDDRLRKKAKTEWTCAICQVSTTSERGLKDHLQGKKHKSKEAAMQVQVSGKNYCIGFCPKKATKSIKVEGTPSPKNEQKLTSPPLLIQKAGNTNSGQDDTPKLQNQASKDSKKKGKAVVKKVRKNKVVLNKEKYKFWCEMCKVGVFSQDVMNSHEKGKKHVARVQMSNQKGGMTATVHKKQNKQTCSKTTNLQKKQSGGRGQC